SGSSVREFRVPRLEVQKLAEGWDVLSQPRAVWSGLELFHGDRNHLTRTGHRVVQIVAELEGELVLSRCELGVEHVLAVAKMDPRRRPFHDGLPGRQAG